MNAPGTPQRTAHLTDDQFAAWMAGTKPDGPAAAHLAQCESCRADIASFGGAIDSFNSAALAWSESRPSVSLRGNAAQAASRPAFAITSLAFATCLLVLTVVPAVHRLGLHGAPADDTTEQADSPAQIERDNQLLLAVDREIGLEPRSPALEYGMAVPEEHAKRPPGARSE